MLYLTRYTESKEISKFEKAVLPLMVDLENHLMKAVWTENVMKCALRCNSNSGCQSFLYSNTGMSRNGFLREKQKRFK